MGLAQLLSTCMGRPSQWPNSQGGRMRGGQGGDHWPVIGQKTDHKLSGQKKGRQTLLSADSLYQPQNGPGSQHPLKSSCSSSSLYAGSGDKGPAFPGLSLKSSLGSLPSALLTLGPGHSLRGALLGTMGCWAASLAPTHSMPGDPNVTTTDVPS